MPFSTRELGTSVRHRLIGVGRIVKSESRDHFLKQLIEQGVVLHPVAESSRHFVNCPVCGYVMATFEVNENWRVETCSAFLLPGMVKGDAVTRYARRLPEAGSYSSVPASLVVGASQGGD
jgi:hypothetical protein